MSFPASLTTRQVTGRFVTHPDGVPAKGSVRIVLQNYMQGPTDNLFVVPFDRTFILENGAFSTVLPATNDPQWTPSYYRVYISTDKTIARPRLSNPEDDVTLIKVRFDVPYDSTDPIDLADAINLPPVQPGSTYILLASKGIANGVASLGSDGKVPAGQLPPGNGGTTAWTDVVGKPSTFPPSAHTHPESDVTGLVAALAGKADSPVSWNDLTDRPDISSGGLAYVWDADTQQYTVSSSTVYVGPVDPTMIGTPPAGSQWFVTDDEVTGGGGGGAITAGQRVTTTGQVGYLGDAHDGNHTINIGDTIPGALSAWHWDDTVFRLNAGNDGYVLDGWTINAGIDCYSSNLTVQNCVVTPPVGTAYYGILARAGALTIQDTTITGAGTGAELGQATSLDNGGVLTVIRCELSGFQDAIGIQQGLISQCHIHDSALAGGFHSDGVQIFGGSSGGTTIEHSLIDITGPAGASTDGVHQNACIYTDAPSGPTTNLTVNDCQLNGGAYEMMLAAAPQGVHVTNCNFGPVDSSGIGTVTADPGTQVLTWTNNHDSSNTLIPDPTL
jgi:hypothetical protein